PGAEGAGARPLVGGRQSLAGENRERGPVVKVLKQASLVVLIAAAVARLAAGDRRPIVETALVDGIIHPVSSEFMRSAIAKADADGAALIIFTLHTPGGLLDSTRDIKDRKS